MAEFEFAGMTFKGGKAAIVFTALSTLGGALWAGFEFYSPSPLGPEDPRAGRKPECRVLRLALCIRDN